MCLALSEVVSDLEWLNEQCSSRRLVDAQKWSAEMLFDLPDSEPTDRVQSNASTGLTVREQRILILAQSCMDCQEFERASKLTAGVGRNSVLGFVHFYARYMAGEKRKLDNMADVNDKKLHFRNENIDGLHRDLETLNEAGTMDSYVRFVYGIVLSYLELKAEARQAFCACLASLPAFWPAWIELSKLIDSRDCLLGLRLPEHWMKQLFTAEVFARLQLHQEAMNIYSALKDTGFDSTYITSMMAVAAHNLQELDTAAELFDQVHKKDPYRMEQMDIYSSTLFVKGMRVDLAALAHHCFDVNKFCPETCCIVGNYYSLRGDHERAVIYFQRALKLDPKNAGAWTLMGHEFMEMKNTSAACLAYRHALEVDKRDYRAWYGLGQAYEILNMFSYATYYYNLAHKSRPQDSRMITALGDVYLKQSRTQDAIKCYWKAHCVGDIEGQALTKLGKLFEKENDNDQAATCYLKFLQEFEKQEMPDSENKPTCYGFLADYFLTKSLLDEAQYYAQLCQDNANEGKGLLKRISQAWANKGSPAKSADLTHNVTPS